MKKKKKTKPFSVLLPGSVTPPPGAPVFKNTCLPKVLTVLFRWCRRLHRQRRSLQKPEGDKEKALGKYKGRGKPGNRFFSLQAGINVQ